MSELNELLERYLRDGNVAAMDEIVAQTRVRLLGTARRIGDPQDAEDTVQATYYALLRRGDKPLEAPLIAWLLTVTVRIAYRRKASRRREVVLVDQLSLPSDEPGPAQTAARLERNARLREEVARLPAKYRDVIVLRYLEGLSSRECGLLLDCTETNVRTRLKRARELLRGRLHPRVSHGLLFVPWWLADQAQAATLMGAMMKTKIAVVATLLALLGIGYVGRDVFRSESADGTARAGRSLPISTDATASEKTQVADRQDGEGPGEGVALKPVDLAAVDRERDIHGTVVQRDGAPVPGARIRVVEFPWQRVSVLNLDGRFEESPGPGTISALDGTFSVRWKRGRMGWLEVTANGLASRRIPYVQAGERLRIVLDEGARILITVKDEAGLPVEGVAMRLFPNAKSTMVSREHTGVSDVAGRCTLEGVIGPGSAYLEPRHAQKGSPGWTAVDIPASGETVEVDVVMSASRTLRGRVTDKVTGDPVEGAVIGMNWVQGGPVRSDENGRYELPGWTGGGAQEIAISHPDYGRDNARVESLDVIDFALVPGDRVVGRIVDASGTPVAGARLTAIGSTRREDGQMVSRGYGVSAADGRFDVGGLRHDMYHSLVVLKPGFGRYLLDFAPAAQAGGRIEVGDVTLPRARSIVGRVVAGEDAPLVRAQVILRGANADRGRLAPRANKPNSFYGESERRYTDDLGRFRFPDLAPGEYTVKVQRAGGALVEKTVRISETQEEVNVEFRFATARAFVVRVETVEGAAVPNAYVKVQFGEGRSAQGKADAEGRVTFQVSGKVHKVETNWVIGAPKDVVYALPKQANPFAEDATQVTIVLHRAASIAGVVQRPDGKPQPRARLQVRQAGSEARTVFVNQNGEFTVTVAGQGEIDLIYQGASTPNGRWSSDSFGGELKGIAPNSHQVVLRLSELVADRSITIRVLDADGKPIAGTPVVLSRAGGKGSRRETDDEGRAHFDGLLAREYFPYLPEQVKHQEKWVAPKPIQVIPDGQEWVMRYRHGTSLEGTVTGARPGAGMVMIYVRNKAGVHVARGWTGGNGKFRLLVPNDEGTGPFTLSAQQGRREADVGVVKDVFIGGEPVTIPLGNQRD